MLALNTLIELRIRDLAKARYKEAMDKKVIWDETIATIRLFQAEFVKCVKDTFTKDYAESFHFRMGDECKTYYATYLCKAKTRK